MKTSRDMIIIYMKMATPLSLILNGQHGNVHRNGVRNRDFWDDSDGGGLAARLALGGLSKKASRAPSSTALSADHRRLDEVRLAGLAGVDRGG